MKKRISFLLSLVMLLSSIISVTGCDLLPKPIEDTNGPDDYSLATITDENIINLDLGGMNMVKETDTFNDGITFFSKNFSGVERVFLINYFAPSDLHLRMAGFYVRGGNFRMVIVNNDEIIADIEPDIFPEVLIRGLTGSVSLIIAGESADFEFTLDKPTCDEFGITVDN